MRTLLVTIVTVLVAVPALAQAPAVGSCYDIHVGPWKSEGDASPTSPEFEPPSRVRFSGTPRADGFPDWRLEVAPNALPSAHISAGWKVRGDTLFVSWSREFTGLYATLLRDGAGWEGEARSSGDVMPWPVERRSIRLELADCATMPPVTAADDPFIRRSVDLNGGEELAVGEPLPKRSDWRIRGSRGRSRMAGAIVGPPFEDAAEVDIRLNRDSIVRWIGLRFPRDVTVNDLIDRLAVAMGSPTDRFQEQGTDGIVDMASWRNRTTSFWIMRYGPDSPATIAMSDPRIAR
ncbi:MAG: hypothetical protein IH876_09510 [Gemmatimonadetes bacterium]|nr:hypothetical protein [Gemmatimonadota bacterium]